MAGIEFNRRILGNRIILLRKKNNMSRDELASLLSVAPSTVASYELAKREPDIQTILRICERFNVSMDFLVGKSDFMNTASEVTREFQDIAEVLFVIKDFSSEQRQRVNELFLQPHFKDMVNLLVDLDKMTYWQLAHREIFLDARRALLESALSGNETMINYDPEHIDLMVRGINMNIMSSFESCVNEILDRCYLEHRISTLRSILYRRRNSIFQKVASTWHHEYPDEKNIEFWGEPETDELLVNHIPWSFLVSEREKANRIIEADGEISSITKELSKITKLFDALPRVEISKINAFKNQLGIDAESADELEYDMSFDEQLDRELEVFEKKKARKPSKNRN